MNPIALALTASTGMTTVVVALAAQLRESKRIHDGIAQRTGHLRRRSTLHLENIHPDFVDRMKERPALFALVSSACPYCEDGMREIARAFGPDQVSICVGYLAADGRPDWLADIQREGIITAGVMEERIARLHVKMVPRFILLDRHDQVLHDQHGHVPDLTTIALRRALTQGT